MSDDDIQIIEPPPPFPIFDAFEDGEIRDSPEQTAEVSASMEIHVIDDYNPHNENNVVRMDTEEDIQIVGDNSYILDDGKGDTTADNLLLLSDSFNDTPVSLNFSTKSASSTRRGGRMCFNCTGEHNVADCPQPLDQRKIQQNKRAFNENNKPRIHQPLTKFTPGTLSVETMHALGLYDNEYPPWIYKMRDQGPMQGYPPAYLKRLVDESNLLEFFTADASTSDKSNRKKINEGNIIYYDGFNTINRRCEAERALNDRYPSYSKEEYAKRIGEYAIRQHEQEMAEEERNPSSKKRRLDDHENGDGLSSSKRARGLHDTPVSSHVRPSSGVPSSGDVAMEDSPASPTLPPVVSKYLTDDMAEPEKMIFPLVSVKQLPTMEKWAVGIQEFKHENVVSADGLSTHKKIHELLKARQK